jgi:hypothetical protein
VETLASSLSTLVIVSPAVKGPDGTVMVIVVDVGLVMILAVDPLVEPVMVFPATRLADAPTVAVITPMG